MGFRFFRIDDCTGHGAAGDFEVSVDLFRAEQHELGSVVEVIGLERVLGEVLDEVEVDAQKIPHGVLVFEISKPAGGGGRGFPACFFDVGAQAVVDPVGDDLAFGRVRLRLVRRRHCARFQRIEDILPSFEPPPRRQVAIQCVQ